MKLLGINLTKDMKCTVKQQNDTEQIIKKSKEMDKDNLLMSQKNHYG